MLELAIYVALTLVAGACVVTQQALNANLRTALDSAAWAGVVSYATGLACMIALALALREPFPAMSVTGRVPALAWTGGVFGAIFIILGIVLIPHLGAATFIALLVTGQMITAMAFDHFGLSGWRSGGSQARAAPWTAGTLYRACRNDVSRALTRGHVNASQIFIRNVTPVTS
jgi:transporter family-2 protein